MPRELVPAKLLVAAPAVSRGALRRWRGEARRRHGLFTGEKRSLLRIPGYPGAIL